MLISIKGHALIEAVIGRSEARLRFQASPCAIYEMDEVAKGQFLHLVLGFFPLIIITQMLHTHSFICHTHYKA